MKQQIGFFIMVCLLCVGILLIPYGKKETEREAVRKEVENRIDDTLYLRVLHGEQVETMSLHAYLAGVVGAELPESFPMEAKKAQAVAARTYALRQMGKEKHPGADICTDSSCCQAWVPEPYLNVFLTSLSLACLSTALAILIGYPFGLTAAISPD